MGDTTKRQKCLKEIFKDKANKKHFTRSRKDIKKIVRTNKPPSSVWEQTRPKK